MTATAEVGTKYYGYLRVDDDDDREVRLRGERVDENTIVLRPTVQGSNLKVVLKYDPALDTWSGEMFTDLPQAAPRRLKAKVFKTETGEPYLFAWNGNPLIPGLYPKVAVFREGYRRNGNKSGGGKK